MERETALAWMAIQRLPGARNMALRKILQSSPDPVALLQAPASTLRAARLPPEWSDARRAALADASWRGERERELDALLDAGVALIDRNHANWPALIDECPDPPCLLYARGDAALLNHPQLAVVGSRKASRGGIANAAAFAGELAKAGMAITSGLALGIDAAAHAGALDVQGRTVAVVGTGIDICYPRRNAALAARIVEGGVVVSELPPGTPPTPEQFPQRNRIISGLSLGVLVVEAALRSGSLITARLALEQNREVFAIPGSIHAASSRGCNALLQSGAKLVTCVADILEEYAGWVTPGAPPPQQPLHCDAGDERLFDALGFEPASLDALQLALGMTAAQLLPRLTELQLQGKIEQRGGQWLRCR